MRQAVQGSQNHDTFLFHRIIIAKPGQFEKAKRNLENITSAYELYRIASGARNEGIARKAVEKLADGSQIHWLKYLLKHTNGTGAICSASHLTNMINEFVACGDYETIGELSYFLPKFGKTLFTNVLEAAAKSDDPNIAEKAKRGLEIAQTGGLRHKNSEETSEGHR